MSGYHYHYGCGLWLLAALGMTMVYLVLLAAWLIWAAGILPLALICLAAGNRAEAGRLVHTLSWDLEALVGQ